MFSINGILITHCTLCLTSYNIHMTLLTSNHKFGHAWAHTPKMIVSIWRNLWCLSSRKKSTSSFTFCLRYCIDITNLLFSVLSVCRATHTQSDTINLKKTSAFILRQKNQLHPPHFSGKIAKIMQNSYFEYSGHAWLRTPKLIASPKMIPST